MPIDHVIYGVRDLAATARRLWDEKGLRASGGGRHEAWGTANLLVPIGAGTYIELMTVEDPESHHLLATTLRQMIASGDRLVAVCMRPESFDSTLSCLGLTPTLGSRRNHNGTEVHWRLGGLREALGPEHLPFFIDWGDSQSSVQAEQAAGIAQHRVEVKGLTWLEVAGEGARLSTWLGGEPPFRVIAAQERGPRRLAIRTDTGELLVP